MIADMVVGLDAAVECEIVALQTTGDVIKDRPLRDAGGKGLFVKELDEALLGGRIDFGVHSFKDVPTELPDGVIVAAVPERADPRDVMVSLQGWNLASLPESAVIGTSSLRRSAQLLAARPDLRIVLLRGNVQTRLARLASGEIDATLLAAAGLDRLGTDIAPARRVELGEAEMIPAPAQGALALTVRSGDQQTAGLLARLECASARVCVDAERALAGVMGGSCHLPLGVYASIAEQVLRVNAVVCSTDGARVVSDSTYAQAAATDASAARALGRTLGERMLAAGAGEILREVEAESRR